MFQGLNERAGGTGGTIVARLRTMYGRKTLLAAAIALTSAQGFTLVGSVNSLFSGLQQQLAVFSRPVVAGSLINGMMPSPVAE